MARDAPQHTLTVYFKENAFTANVDGLPQNPGEFFSAEFTQELLDEQMALGRISETNLPLYVASVTYGRILMFSVTSEENITTIKAAMNGVAKWGTGEVSDDAKADYRRIVAGNTSDIVTVGGSSGAASAAIASGDFTEYFKEATALTEYTPISYVLRDMKGNIACLGETTKYTVKTCEPLVLEPRVTEVALDGFEVVGDCEGSNTGPAGGEFHARFYMGNDDSDPEADTRVLQWGEPQSGQEGDTVSFDSPASPGNEPIDGPVVLDPGKLNADGEFPIDGHIYERYMTDNHTFFHHVGDFEIRIDPDAGDTGSITEAVRVCSPTQGPDHGGNKHHDPYFQGWLPLCTDPPDVRFGPETVPIVWQTTGVANEWKAHQGVDSNPDDPGGSGSCRVILNYTIWSKP